MTVCAPRPTLLYPFPIISSMTPGVSPKRHSVVDTEHPHRPPEAQIQLQSERQPSPGVSPKRPRLSTPTGGRSLLSELAGPTSPSYSPAIDQEMISPPRSAPLIQLPSFSTILRDHALGDSGMATGVDRYDFDSSQGLKRLAIGPSSFSRPLSHGDPHKTSAAWPKEPQRYDHVGLSSAPIVQSQDARDISRVAQDDERARSLEDRRRKRHGRDEEHRHSLPSLHHEHPRQARASLSRTIGSHSRTRSLVPPSEAWFSPAAPPASWTRDDWRKDEQRAYNLGFEDAMRSVESGIVGVMGQQYRNPTLVKHEIPPALSASPPTFRFGASPHRLGPSLHSPQRPLTATLSDQEVYWQRHTERPGIDGLFPEAGLSTSPRRSLTSPNLSLNRGYTLPPLQAHSFSRSPESTSPIRHSTMISSTYSSSPSGESNTTLPQRAGGSSRGIGGPGPGRGHRQLISCYPCRTKKLKCDGNKPCSQCVRRKEVDNCAFAQLIKRRGKAKRRDDERSESNSHSPVESRVDERHHRHAVVPKVEEDLEMDRKGDVTCG